MNDPTNSRYRYLYAEVSGVHRRFVKQENDKTQKDPENRLADIPAHGTYGALLFRAEWKARRIEILNRDKCCVICKNGNDLQVHHRQYHFIVREHRLKNPWEYTPNLLITLCGSCHKRGHNKFKVPTINI